MNQVLIDHIFEGRRQVRPLAVRRRVLPGPRAQLLLGALADLPEERGLRVGQPGAARGRREEGTEEDLGPNHQTSALY